ncbi:hypothetical protein EMIT0P176_270046 [Pseudomonas sp. IT-P176]
MIDGSICTLAAQAWPAKNVRHKHNGPPEGGPLFKQSAVDQS